MIEGDGFSRRADLGERRMLRSSRTQNPPNQIPNADTISMQRKESRGWEEMQADRSHQKQSNPAKATRAEQAVRPGDACYAEAAAGPNPTPKSNPQCSNNQQAAEATRKRSRAQDGRKCKRSRAIGSRAVAMGWTHAPHVVVIEGRRTRRRGVVGGAGAPRC